MNENSLNIVQQKITETQTRLETEEDPTNKVILTNSLSNLQIIKEDLQGQIQQNESVIASASNNNTNNESNSNNNEANNSSNNETASNNSNNTNNENSSNNNEANNSSNNETASNNSNNTNNENSSNNNEANNSSNNETASNNSNNTNNENSSNNNEANNSSNNETASNNSNNTNNENSSPALTPIISIGDLDLNYIDQIENIDNSDLNDLQKAEEKNKLNENLLNKIEQEISATNSALENDPNNSELLARKQKLNEIKTSITQDIEANNKKIQIEEENNFVVADSELNDILNENNANSTSPNEAVIALVNSGSGKTEAKVENTKIDQFKSEDAKNQFEEIKATVNSVKEKKAENTQLKNQQENADPKQAKKLQKQIDKNNKEITKQETEALVKLGNINKTEIDNNINRNNELSKEIAENGITNNTEILKNSERKIAEAVVLQEEATQLRKQAEKTKNSEKKGRGGQLQDSFRKNEKNKLREDEHCEK